MGKQFWAGAVLLALILALTFGIWWGLGVICDPAAQALELASQTALAGNLPDGVNLARQAKDRWEKFRHFSAAVADHSPMDEIDKLFAQMEVYAQSGEEAEFASCCAQLSCLVSSIAEAHSLTWWNVF